MAKELTVKISDLPNPTDINDGAIMPIVTSGVTCKSTALDFKNYILDGFQGGGLQGFQGNAGAQGNQGSSGAQGSIGNDGAQGAQGNDGAQGSIGNDGAQGSAGNDGAQGNQGSTGAQGSSGVSGGQVYYFNLSQTQSPYKEFAQSYINGTEQTTTITVASSDSGTIQTFQTPSGDPNTNTIVPSIWTFYLHVSRSDGSKAWEVYCKVYKRDIGGTNTFLFSSDPTLLTLGTNTIQQIVSGAFYSGTSLLNTDRLVVEVVANNLSDSSSNITFYTEDLDHYSYASTPLKIIGAKGEQGFQGAQGNQGLTGAQGNQGAGGFGAQGAQGAQGEQGAGGFGAQGAQGEQGSTGAQGNQGNNGAQGAQGFQGINLISGVITSGYLGNASVVSGSIASGSIGQFHHASGSVTSGHVGNNAVVSGSIASGTIGTFHFSSGGVLSGNIASGQIGRNHLSSGAVGSGAIASGVVGSFKLASGAVLSGHVGNNAVVSGSIASGQVGTPHLADNSIQSGTIPSGTISAFHLGATGLLSGYTLSTDGLGFLSWIAGGGITGTGSSGYFPIFDNTSSIANSILQQIGQNFLFGDIIFGHIDTEPSNLFIGRLTGSSLVSGSSLGNTVLGSLAAYNSQTISENVIIGNGAYYAAQSGFSNTVIGLGALSSMGAGTRNTVVGRYAASQLTSGQRNVILGTDVGSTTYYLDDSVVIGDQIGLPMGGKNMIAIGSQTSGLGNDTTVIGNINTKSGVIYGSIDFPYGITIGGGNASISSGGIISGSITLGSGSVTSGTIASGQVGQFHLSSGSVTSGVIASGQVGQFHLSSGSVTSGVISSGVIGINHLSSGSVRSGVIASGQIGRFHHASGSVTSGHIGNNAVTSGSLASGFYLIAGYGAFNPPTNLIAVPSTTNTFSGYDYNTAFGTGACNVIGNSNTSFGYNALGTTSKVFGASNVAIGNQAFYYLGSGSSNIAIGTFAGLYLSGGSNALTMANNNIYFGTQACSANDAASYEIVIGANSIGFGSGTTTIGHATNTKSGVIYGAIAFPQGLASGTITSGAIASGQVGKYHLASGSTVSYTNAASAPVSPLAGDLWYDTNNGSFAVYVNDGNTSQWVEVGGGAGIIVSGVIQSGNIGNNAVTSGNIASGQVGFNHLSNDWRNRLNRINGFRIGVQSGISITSADQAAQSTIYLNPYTGDSIELWDGNSWQLYSTSGTVVSLTVTGLTSGKNYDIYAAPSGANPALSFSTAWTSDSVRADTLTYKNGTFVLSTDNTKRLVGTIRASAPTTTEDTLTNRFVANFDNQVPRPLYNTDPTNTYTFSSTAANIYNNNSGNQILWVQSVAGTGGALSAWTGIARTAGIGYAILEVVSNASAGTAASACYTQLATTDYKGGQMQHTQSVLGYNYAYPTVRVSVSGTLQVNYYRLHGLQMG